LQTKARIVDNDPLEPQRLRGLLTTGRGATVVELVREHRTPEQLAAGPQELQDLALAAAAAAHDTFWLVTWAHACAADTSLSAERLLVIAGPLVALDRHDHAQPLIARALALAPQDEVAHGLLGRSLLAMGEPERALRHLRRLSPTRLEADFEAQFALAEALWQVGDRRAARPIFTELSRRLRIDDHTGPRLMRRGWALIRSGQVEEGRAELITAADAAQASLGEQLAPIDHALEEALQDGAQAAALDPDVQERLARLASSHAGEPKVMLRLGRAASLEGRHDDAIAVTRASFLAGGPGAATAGDLAFVLERAGHEREARTYARFERAQQPRSTRAASLGQRLDDALAPTYGGAMRFERRGADRTERYLLHGTLVSQDESARLSIVVGQNEYRGVAQAFDAGRTRLASSLDEAWLSFEHRASLRDFWSVGVHTFPDAPGPGDTGLWLDYARRDSVRGSSLMLRAYVHELLDEAAAGVALGARQGGLKARWAGPIGARSWFELQGGLRQLSVLDAVGSEEHTTSPERRAQLQLGTTLYGEERIFADPPRGSADLSLTGLPTADSAYWLNTRSAVSVFGELDARRMGNGGAVADLLPIAERATQASLGLRYDRALDRGLVAMVSGSLGEAFEDHDSIHRFRGGLGWRPHYGLELTLAAEAGRSTDRGSLQDDHNVLFGITLRR